MYISVNGGNTNYFTLMIINIVLIVQEYMYLHVTYTFLLI